MYYLNEFFFRLCHCYVKLGDSLEAKRACSDAIKINNEPRLYCDRAEANLAEDMFDEVRLDKMSFRWLKFVIYIYP